MRNGAEVARPFLSTRPRGKLTRVSGDKPARTPSEDVLFVVGESEHGHAVLRKRDDKVELGEVRPTQEGKSIHGEVVRLKPRDEGGRVFDVEVLAAPPTVPSARASGPAQVATNTYRANWDAIFGERAAKHELN